LGWITGMTDSVAHLAVVRTADRIGFRERLHSAGIATDVHYPIADHRQPGLPLPARELPLPVTEKLVDQVVSIPCHPDLRDDEIDRVANALGDVH
jgi:dTDP-4-amino-4,6-dideoxygalactose transaminase